MKLGRWRSRTNLTFVTTNLHHPLFYIKTKNIELCIEWNYVPKRLTLVQIRNTSIYCILFFFVLNF